MQQGEEIQRAAIIDQLSTVSRQVFQSASRGKARAGARARDCQRESDGERDAVAPPGEGPSNLKKERN